MVEKSYSQLGCPGLYIYHVFTFFRYEFDTDHTVYQLNILHALTQEPLGVINWFAVHPTSMNNTNHLISGDNKGLASQLLERHVNQGNDVSSCLHIIHSVEIAGFFYHSDFT